MRWIIKKKTGFTVYDTAEDRRIPKCFETRAEAQDCLDFMKKLRRHANQDNWHVLVIRKCKLDMP